MSKEFGFNSYRALFVLGLKSGASARKLKSAYRKLARKHHPDKGGSAEEFKIVKGAYDYLVENGTTEKAELPSYGIVGLGNPFAGVTMRTYYVERS